jgi:membrane protease YdiL (CAAX protease family)
MPKEKAPLPLLSWLLPPQRHRAVPWGGAEVFFVGSLALLFIPATVAALLAELGWGSSARLAAPVFAAPLQVAALVGLTRLSSGALPYQLGLTAHRLGRNLLLGVLAWSVLSPAAYAVYYLAVLTNRGSDEHPLTKFAAEGLSPPGWGLLLTSAVVTAPFVEELLFRGLIQPWLMRRRGGGLLAALFALAYQTLILAGQAWPWDGLSPGEAARRFAPAAVMAAVGLGGLLLAYRLGRRLSNPEAAPAVVGTALLFGVMHADVWPSPVPLTLLGVGLGWLAYRTQSLAGPVLAHALFNAIACAALLARAPAAP